MARTSPPSDAERTTPAPVHRSYLVYCDESGMDGASYYGFGSLWMPRERRGDFARLIQDLRERHGYTDEIKWQHVNRRSEALYTELIDEFFARRWLMFHSLIVRKSYSERQFHADFDEEKRKRFAMLISQKVKFFCEGDPSKTYHVRVDPLPSRYMKADEAAFKIIAASLKKELGLEPVRSLHTRDSRDTPGIQVTDLLLGATLADWQQRATSQYKLRVRQHLARHLGWSDLLADTYPGEWKFNIWYFYAPSGDCSREVETRPVRPRFPVPPLPRRTRQR
jgi:hypothetical protein